MKRIFLPFLLIIMVGLVQAQESFKYPRCKVISGQVFVKFKNGVSEQSKQETLAKVGGTKLELLNKERNVYRVYLLEGMSIKEAIKLLESDSNIECVEPVYIYHR